MATATLSPGSQVARNKSRSPSLFWRIFAAVQDSRMRQAQREIARHSHLFPTNAVTVEDSRRGR